MLVYSNLVLSYKCKVFFELFSNFCKYLANISMTSAPNILAKLNYQFNVSSAFFDLLLKRCRTTAQCASLTPSLAIQLYLFFDVIKLSVNTIYLFSPLPWIDLTFKDLIVYLLTLIFFLINVIRVKKVDFSLFCIVLHSIFLRNHGPS